MNPADRMYFLMFPPQVWAIMIGLGHLQVIASDPNIWVQVSIDNMTAFLNGYLDDHRAWAEGWNDAKG